MQHGMKALGSKNGYVVLSAVRQLLAKVLQRLQTGKCAGQEQFYICRVDTMIKTNILLLCIKGYIKACLVCCAFSGQAALCQTVPAGVEVSPAPVPAPAP
jgi:hypothetical protein